jgi:hypothetical protein
MRYQGQVYHPVNGILSGINALTASPVQSQGVVEIVNALPIFFM